MQVVDEFSEVMSIWWLTSPWACLSQKKSGSVNTLTHWPVFLQSLQRVWFTTENGKTDKILVMKSFSTSTRHCYLCQQANQCSAWYVAYCKERVATHSLRYCKETFQTWLFQVPGNVLENRIPLKLPYVPATQTYAGTALSTTLWPA